ncbi:MAG: iron-containing alcohol dehydrogenase [Sedimentisphaerales bacterium]|nr:iron-containing alcohol dehydrogenase [Sedimentisphaerales bacterium]
MRFEFTTAGRIIFGAGTVKEVAPLVSGWGRRAFIVTGRSLDRSGAMIEQIHSQGIPCVVFGVPGEPSTTLVARAAEQARGQQCDVVVAIGGGSVIDAGKAVAAMLTNEGALEDYLEVVGRGQRLQKHSAPFIAVPTTAGTGTEVTRNAVLSVPEYKVKVSMRSAWMLPQVAVVDPELTYSMPPAVTASTGLDALTQLIEPYVSIRANPFTDGFCREGLKRAGRSLRRAYEDGTNKEAREDMSLASLLGGLALANAGLGAVHGFAGPLGGMFNAPHGMICARLLLYIMEANIRALQQRASDSPAIVRYHEIAQILTGNPDALAEDGISWVGQLCADLQIESLAEFGLKQVDITEVVAKSQKASSMKGNPVQLSEEELTGILMKAIKT